jgi:hypothetical protein
MALRTINGTIRDRSGNPIANGLVQFRLEESVYSATATYVAGTTLVTSDPVGLITLKLWGAGTYQVVEPGDTTYTIVVPDGDPDVPLQLEVLRAENNPTAEPQSTFDEMLDTTLGSGVVDGLQAAEVGENPPSTENPVATIADLNAAASGIVMAETPADFITVFDAVTLGASPETETVEAEDLPTGAATKSGAFVWVRAQTEDAGATFIFAGVYSVTLPTNTVYQFQLFVPLTSGTFDVQASGNGSTVSVRIYPQAIL